MSFLKSTWLVIFMEIRLLMCFNIRYYNQKRRRRKILPIWMFKLDFKHSSNTEISYQNQLISIFQDTSNTQIPLKKWKNPYFRKIFACGAYFRKSALTPPHPQGGYQGLYMILTLANVSRNFTEISPMGGVRSSPPPSSAGMRGLALKPWSVNTRTRGGCIFLQELMIWP